MNVLTATPDQFLWYDNSIIMTFIGVILGALIGFIGSIIQSRITAKNNIEVVKQQGENEIKRHRYIEQEKLYSDIISFLPHLVQSINRKTHKVNLSTENTIMLNSFHYRLRIFSSNELFDKFFDLVEYIVNETDDKKCMSEIDKFTELLLDDLNKTKEL